MSVNRESCGLVVATLLYGKDRFMYNLFRLQPWYMPLKVHVAGLFPWWAAQDRGGWLSYLTPTESNDHVYSGTVVAPA